MIKFPEHTENVRVTIRMKVGTYYIKKDITDQPFGENERLISFWLNDTIIRTVPLEDVEYIDFHFEK